MFSTFIRLGAALSCAAVLSSCGGNSVAETQQSTPEGIYTGNLVTTGDPANGLTGCSQAIVQFVVATGSIYTFYPSSTHPEVLNAADSGTITFGGNAMSASLIEVIAPASVPFIPASGQTSADNPYASIAGLYTSMCDNFKGNVASMSMVGSYQTGVNLTEIYTFSGLDASGYTDATQSDNKSLLYSTAYQGVQSLSTLAGTYNGYVSTSQLSEAATFTIGPPSVPANAGNSLGVSVVTGTGADGCTYSGSVSPLYKGNGYTMSITSGNSPCKLPQTQFGGLIYLNTSASPNILYSFSPNAGRNDGVIFSGKRVSVTGS